jgi:glucose-6-phosphate 1-dehydrogenase
MTSKTTKTTKNTPLIGKYVFHNKKFNTITFNISRSNNDEKRFEHLLKTAKALPDSYPDTYLTMFVKEYKDHEFIQVQTKLNQKQRMSMRMSMGEKYELQLTMKKLKKNVRIDCKSIKLHKEEFPDDESDAEELDF